MRYEKKILLTLVLFLTIICKTNNIFAEANSIYCWNNESNLEKQVEEKNKSNINLQSGSAILIEQNTGEILYKHNIHEKLKPASVTKVMTILLIMEEIDSGRISYTDKIPCTENAAAMGGSQIWLDVREELTVDEMLKAICVVSANDCTVAMAEYISGSQNSFVEKMNKKAKELGMNDTTFKNCHGIDEEGHVTSAYDISLMSRELLLKHPEVKKYTTIWMDTLREGKSQLVNTNKLIKNYKGATGLKTGSTSGALYNLSASASRDNLSLIAVIMKAPTTKIRFNEAKMLLDYGFNNYTYKELGKEGDVVANVTINKGKIKMAEAVLEKNIGFIIERGTENKIEQKLEIEENINAPTYERQKIGKISYKDNKGNVIESSIILKESIEKNNLNDIIRDIYRKYFKIFK